MGLPVLYDLAAAHHHHAVREPAHDREVVRDQQQALALRLELGELVEDTCLDGDIECRGRLVRDDDLRSGGDRGCDERALPQPARELVRIPPRAQRRLRHSDLIQQPEHALVAATRRADPVHLECFADLRPDPAERIERAECILEHQADAGAADLSPAVLIEGPEVPVTPPQLGGEDGRATPRDAE